jgi:uncharacterized damage-inducible protein DinB
MGHGLHDPIEHNTWANAQVITFCQGLDEPTLHATVPGAFGTIIETLRHTLDSEMSYLFRLIGAESAYPWQRGEAVGLDLLAGRAALLAATWERFLAGDAGGASAAGAIDSERPLEARGSAPERYTVPAGVFIAQALHHGSEHRAQICTILGALGHAPPDVSAWGYAFASGRAMV